MNNDIGNFTLYNTNLIYNLEEVRSIYGSVDFLEKDRIYCKHDFLHALDVARIFYILCLENNINESKDLIYTVAILHDLGRKRQYVDNTPHNEESVVLAKKLLNHTNFTKREVDLAIDTINEHRNDAKRDESENLGFKELFYKADKLSRVCFRCKARKSCKWSEDKKNKLITY